jgi:hypothetical protein
MSNLEQKIKYLRVSRFFNEASSDLRNMVAGLIIDMRIQPGEVLFREGE